MRSLVLMNNFTTNCSNSAVICNFCKKGLSFIARLATDSLYKCTLRCVTVKVIDVMQPHHTEYLLEDEIYIETQYAAETANKLGSVLCSYLSSAGTRNEANGSVSFC